jgi:hypothetical protein
MTTVDDTTHHRDATNTGPGANGHDAGAGADETMAWTGDASGDPGSSGADARATAERMLAQLQSMIDTVATQAAPVVRQIGAKAAELAAVAADRAGPLAHRAADATADASVKIAERSRVLAADLRNRNAAEGGVDGGSGDQPTPQPDVDQGGIAAADLGGADDAEERSSHDDPSEGFREG